MKTSEILIQAKSLISKPENWQQLDWGKHDDHSCMCALGAVGVAMGKDINRMLDPEFNATCITTSKAAEALKEVVGEDACMYGTFANYNDASERTHAEIMEAFDKAISNQQALDD